MLQFLETGNALYLLAAVCILGIISKWMVQNSYKRLIRETDNMTLTKNKNLRAFKQRAESTYRMNQGISHVQPYLDRQMYEFRFGGAPINSWANFSTQMTILCFLLGGAAAFAAYWLRSDTSLVVLYGAVGILAGLLTILVDNGACLPDKRQQLYASLENYLENHMICRLEKERCQDAREGKEVAETARSGTREAARSLEPVALAAAAERGVSRKRVGPKAVRREPVAEGEGNEGGGQRDIDYLKRSLEQIAASREKARDSRQEENWLKELNPDEIKLIGEIIKEYLS